MRPTDKYDIKKILDKIYSNNFESYDIEMLFLKLRAFNKGNLVFKELADFVAHNNERDRGLVNNILEHRYLSIKLFQITSNTKIDITEPFPAWVLKLIQYQARLYKEKDFKRKFNISIKNFLKELKRLFPIDEKNQTTYYCENTIGESFANALNGCLSFISDHSAFDQDDIIKQLIKVIRLNNIKIDETVFKMQSDKIILCLLLLLHKSIYITAEGFKLGRTIIAYENIDKEHPYDSEKTNFGNLLIAVHFHIETENQKSFSVMSPIILTKLNAAEWCEEDLFKIVFIKNNIKYVKLYLDDDLVINQKSKLTKAIF